MLTRMLVLWLLSESPLHGYRIKRILSDPAMRFWFPVFDAAIYSALRSLVKLGYARVQRTERVGKRPPRTRYAITSAGRRHFEELLSDAWTKLEPPFDPFNLALAAVPEVGAENVPRLLHERRAALVQRTGELALLRSSSPAAAIVDRQLALTEAELDWIDSHLAKIDAENLTRQPRRTP